MTEFDAFTQSRKVKISLTPLIDVVFILLLFFMLTSSFSHLFQVDATVSTAGKSAKPVVEKPLIANVIDDNTLRINGIIYQLQDDSFQTLLATVDQDETPILIRATQDATIQDLVLVMESLKDLGIERLHLMKSVDAGEPL